MKTFEETLEKSLKKALNSAKRNNKALQNLKDPTYWKKQEEKMNSGFAKSHDSLAGWIAT